MIDHLPIHLSWRLEHSVEASGVRRSVSLARLGRSRLGRMILFEKGTTVMTEQARDTPGSPSRSLVENVLRIVEAAYPLPPRESEKLNNSLRGPLTEFFASRFEDGQVLTALDMNSLQTRLDDLERRLEQVESSPPKGPHGILTSGPRK